MLGSWIGQKKAEQKLLEELEQKRRESFAEATRLLLETDEQDKADRALRRAKLSQDIQVQYTLHSRHRFIYPLFALACGAIVSFLWLFPQPNPRVHLDLDVETVVLRLAERKDFSWKKSPGLKVNRLLIDGRFTVDASGLGLDGNAGRLWAGGTDLTFKQLTISKGARLEVECSNDSISLYIYEGAVQGLLELRNGTLRLFDSSGSVVHTVQSPVPESLRFSAKENSSHRLHLRLQGAESWHIHGLQVTDMRFQQEVPPDSNNFVSSIRKGTIELPEIKKKEFLLDRDQLHLTKAASTRLRLDFPASGVESFNLLFLGRAVSLAAGPDDFERDLTPSLLTWIYHQKQLYFCWGALVFAYSLLTNLPSLFSRRK